MLPLSCAFCCSSKGLLKPLGRLFRRCLQTSLRSLFPRLLLRILHRPLSGFRLRVLLPLLFRQCAVSDNASCQALDIRLRGGHGILHPAVFQDRDPVGILHDLIHLVGDHDDSFPAVRHLSKGVEHALGFLRRQDSGRLIQDQHLRPLVQELDDLHTLLLTDRKLPDIGLRSHLQVILPGALPDLLLHFVTVEEKGFFARI